MSYIGNVKVDSTTHLVGSTLYGTCDTAAGTAAKVVTCANFDKLLTGVTIHVKFTYSNTASSPTLNVNSTGAKTIYRYGTTKPTGESKGSWNAGSVVAFTYDGSAWMMNDWLNDVIQYSVVTDMANGLVPQTFNGSYAQPHFLMDNTSQHTATWEVPPNATTSYSGYMSAEDKTFIEGLKTINRIIVIDIPSFSSLPTTANSTLITADHVLLRATLSNTKAQNGEWTVTTSDGSVTVSGTINGSTTLQLILGLPDND